MGCTDGVVHGRGDRCICALERIAAQVEHLRRFEFYEGLKPARQLLRVSPATNWARVGYAK
jgi:hypothetical protein